MPGSSSETRFMLILRGGKADKDFSPSEYGITIKKYLDWIEGLREKGLYEAGEPLEETGKFLSGKRGAIVTDGPFAESKETVGGYFIIKARDLDEATEIAKGCPIFESGGGLEVRQIAQIPSVEPA